MRARLPFALLLALSLARAAYAVWPLPPHVTYPCVPPNDACYQCDDWLKDDSFQVRLQARSSRNTASGPFSDGLCNPSSFSWCKLPQLSNVSSFFIPAADGSPRLRVVAQYDFPDSYCQFDDIDSCHWAIWPIPYPNYQTALDLLGDESVIGEPIPAIYESGIWMPTQNAGCNGVQHTYTVQAINKCHSTAVATVVVTDPTASDAICQKTDRRPGCNLGAGKPVHVGSGDVSVTEDLFTVGGMPLPISLRLSYHSSKPLYPGKVTTPLSTGWTHTFNETLRGVDPFGIVLYHLTAEGYETLYEIGPDGIWRAMSPAELRTTIVKSGSQYLLKDLDGTVKAFDTTTGQWLSTTDRWQNTLSGTYTSSLLTAITDGSTGRSVSLAYTSGRLSSMTVGGQQWRFAYDGSGNLTQIFDPLHTGSTPWRTVSYVNDSSSVTRLLSEVRDEAGFLLEGHAYDSADRGTTSVSQGGQDSVTIAYNTPAAGKTRVTHVIDNSVSQVSDYTLEYNGGRYRATQITGTCPVCGTSETQSFTYDTSNRVTSHTDGRGYVTAFSYNADGNVTSKTEAQGTPNARTTTYAYGYAPWPNFVTQITQPSAAKSGASKITTQSWNTGGTFETTLTRTESGYLSESDAAGSPTTLTSTQTFDAQHRLLAVNGPRTDVVDVTTNAYYASNDATVNRRGRLQTSTNAVSLTTTFDDYDIFGTARSITDANGVVTEHVTDGRGRVTQTTVKMVGGDPNETADYVTAYTFDGRDRLEHTTLPGGNGLRYQYEDGTNHSTGVIRLDAAGKERERHQITLNVAGAVASEEDQICTSPAASCASWLTRRSHANTYDAFGRLKQTDYPVPAGAKVVYTYDANGNLATFRDENHVSANTSYAYDELNRLSSVTQVNPPAANVVTAYTYDQQDNLKTVTDPNGNVTSYSYDDFGRLQRQVSPVSGTTAYVYDPAGNLTSTTDAIGTVTARSYDAANRVTSAVASRSGVATETVTWTYDDATAGKYAKGRLSSMTDPTGTTAYAYERRGMVRELRQTIESMVATTSFAYDGNGNRSQVRYPSGLAIDYTFDFADRPATARSPFVTYVAAVTREPFGPATEIRYGNGTIVTRGYDARYRMSSNKLVLGGVLTLASYGYTLDAVGNVTEVADLTDAAYTRTFSYDDLNRLRTANAAGLWGNATYTYDAIGNMLSSTLRAATFTYVAPTPKLSSVTENAATRNVTYDGAGNETAVGASNFSYSSRNLLALADGFAYAYDGRGVRTITTGSGNIRRYSVYTPELRLLAESSYTSAASRRFEYQYVWFDGAPVAQLDAPGTLRSSVRWTFTDHLGTALLLTDFTGAVWWRAEYEPYGRIALLRTSNRHQPLRFPGQEAEQLTSNNANGDTERSYNIFRWYREGWGRYSSVDPIMNLATAHAVRGIVDAANLATFIGYMKPYLYAGGNPIVLDDSNGLGNIPGFGKLKTDKSCTKTVCSKFHPLDEDVDKPKEGPPPALSPPLAPGGSMSVDGVYWSGAILKIPDNCNATLVCDSKGVAHFEFNCLKWFKDRPQRFINGTPPPPPAGWPPFLP